MRMMAILGVSTLIMSTLSTAAAKPLRFYVATNGNDAWSGKQREPNPAATNGPFATLIAARDAIREVKAAEGLQQPVEVLVRGGTYYLSEPLRLGSEDSGTLDYPIAYKAFPGEQPIMSGGKVITGWHQYKDKIMCAELAEAKDGKLKFKQLFFNGQRQIRARGPNFDPDDPLYGGWAFVEARVAEGEEDTGTFRYEPGTFPRRWAKPSQGEIFIFFGLCWNNDIIPIKQVDHNGRTITLNKPLGHELYGVIAGNRFYVENLLEELDQPGEWCLDTETGMVYFWPPTGSVEDGEVVAPVNDRLIELKGTADEAISYIRVSGFTFTQTLSLFPPRHVSCNTPNTEGHAVYLESAEHCTIGHNFFDAVGGDAVRLQNDNAYNRIVGNEIAYAGAQGICLSDQESGGTFPQSWRDNAELLRETSRQRHIARSNIISRNHIHHCGVIDKAFAGIKIHGLNCVNNVISHNLIHHMPLEGIALTLGFGSNIIEYNELHTLCLEMADCGGFVSNRFFVIEDDEELCNGTVIRYNLIRDIVGCGAYEKPMQPVTNTKADGKIWTPYYTWAIYFDNSGMKTTVYGNICIGNTLGGISMPVADPKDNLVANNIFGGSSVQQMDLRFGTYAEGNRIVRNIVYCADPKAALLATHAGRGVAECDYNLYYHTGGQKFVVSGVEGDSFAKWQEMGFDTHSVVADPLFVDPANGDYRLRPDSPALKLGFQRIPVERIGLDG